MNNRHLLHKNNRWQFQNEGSDRPIRSFDTKGERLEFSTEYIRKHGGSLKIHTTDGTFQSEVPDRIRPERRGNKDPGIWSLRGKGGTMREIFTALFIFFLVLPTFAEERKSPKSSSGAVKFDFRGLRMGEPFPTDNPRFEESCARPQAGDLPSERTECTDINETIGPVSVSISYTFLHKRLVHLSILFKAKDFSTVVGGFTEKFGKPHKLTHQTVQTHAGATFLNEIATWHTDSGDLIVSKYSVDIEGGNATIYSPEGLRDLNAQSGNDAKKAADGL